MSKQHNLDLLGKLCRLPGLPGREFEVAKAIREEMQRPGWETRTDRLGNVIAHRPGSGPRVMLMAHMDEVGLIVRRITKDGFLLVERFGGMGVLPLLGGCLTLWTDNGPIKAHGGVLPQHLSAGFTPELNKVYIDIGASSAEEVADMHVQVGDGLTWDASLEQIGKSCVRSKALDDRLGCYSLLQIAGMSEHSDLPCDLYLAFIVQEETMMMGGSPVAQAVKPDIIIGIDGTLTFDTPDLEGQQCDIRIGAGPAIKMMDAIRGKQFNYLPSWRLVQLTQKIAVELQIDTQREVVTGISTALSPLNYVNEGTETLALSIPIRYHHSPVETADLNDVTRLNSLVFRLLETGLSA